MKTHVAVLIALGLLLRSASAQTGKGRFGAITPMPGTAQLSLQYIVSSPGGTDPYLYGPGNSHATLNPWHAYVQRNATDPTARVAILSVTDEPRTKHLIITLEALPTDLPMNQYFWQVSFTPPDNSNLAPQLFQYVPINGPGAESGKSCDNTSSGARPVFCPPSGGTPADISIMGAFVAGGGTKPIYQLSAKVNAFLPTESAGPATARNLWHFDPGMSWAVQINQNTSPPSNRTRFDPDSIMGGLDFQRIVTTGSGGVLTGLQLDEALPTFEFSRSDPSSNVVFKSSVLFALRSMPLFPKVATQGARPSARAYLAIYPVLSFEGGKNLNRPGMLAKTPVDLSHYNGIARVVLGAEGTLGFVSADKKTDNVSLNASYRARIPMYNEPFIMTEDGVTTVSLTTKTRHWAEVDLNISPASFKFFAITAQYQYGALPPVFSFVDHKVSIGLTFTAVQTNKPTLPSAIKYP